MTRVELLRDLYVRAYERSTQEYLAIKQDLAEPDPIRLKCGTPHFMRENCMHGLMREGSRKAVLYSTYLPTLSSGPVFKTPSCKH